MPSEHVPTQSAQTISISLMPVLNILSAMSLMLQAEEYPGSTGPLNALREGLSPEGRYRHRLLFEGIGMEALSNLVPVDEEHTFGRFLHDLEALDATTLRDRVLHALVHSVHLRLHLDKPTIDTTAEALLADEAAYLEYVAHTDKKTSPTPPSDVHHAVYALFHDPPALKQTILAHLRDLWHGGLLVEWERGFPYLHEVVKALQQFELGQLPLIEAIEAITGRSLRDALDVRALQRFRQITLIPSRHTGPYVFWFGDEQHLRLLFGARKPTRANATAAPLLDNGELLNHLQALADPTRFDILLAIKRQGELSTQQVIDIFNLNKSAASRHLRQLRANELLRERRDNDNKGKFYSLNRPMFDALQQTLKHVFGE